MSVPLTPTVDMVVDSERVLAQWVPSAGGTPRSRARRSLRQPESSEGSGGGVSSSNSSIPRSSSASSCDGSDGDAQWAKQHAGAGSASGAGGSSGGSVGAGTGSGSGHRQHASVLRSDTWSRESSDSEGASTAQLLQAVLSALGRATGPGALAGRPRTGAAQAVVPAGTASSVSTASSASAASMTAMTTALSHRQPEGFGSDAGTGSGPSGSTSGRVGPGPLAGMGPGPTPTSHSPSDDLFGL